MGEFVDAALTFPAVVFTFLLVVVAAYWLFVVFGAVGADSLDGDAADDGEPGGFAGFLAGIGLGELPVTVVLSLLIVIAWFACLVGVVALRGTGSVLATILSVLVLLAALACAWVGTWLLARVLRPVASAGPGPSRGDFVGQTCVIRTGRVGRDFGQAEVTAADGSSAIVQVRQTRDDPMPAGSAAVIYDLDADGEFFWVMPVDAVLNPQPPSVPTDR